MKREAEYITHNAGASGRYLRAQKSPATGPGWGSMAGLASQRSDACYFRSTIFLVRTKEPAVNR